MIVTEKGKYKVLKDFNTTNSISIGTVPKDSIIQISQVDDIAHRVIGSELFDWMPNELPVEKINK